MASKRGLYYDIMQVANETLDEMSRDDIDDEQACDIARDGLSRIYGMASDGCKG